MRTRAGDPVPRPGRVLLSWPLFCSVTSPKRITHVIGFDVGYSWQLAVWPMCLYQSTQYGSATEATAVFDEPES